MKKKFTNFSINSLYCLIQNCFTGVSQLNISKYCLKENIIVDENMASETICTKWYPEMITIYCN